MAENRTNFIAARLGSSVSSRRILQGILAVIGLVLVSTGLLGVVTGVKGYDVTPTDVMLDTNLRFYAGLSIGLGLILWGIIPAIEKQKTLFTLIAGMILIGGLGRLVSMIAVEVPSIPFVIFALLEVLFPALIIWQRRIAHQAGW